MLADGGDLLGIDRLGGGCLIDRRFGLIFEFQCIEYQAGTDLGLCDYLPGK